MTRRSALLAGLAVMFVLLGGQVYGTWLRRPAAQADTVGSAPQPVRTTAGPTGAVGGDVPDAAAPPPPPTPTAPAPTTAAATTPPAPPPGSSGGKYAAMGVRLVTGQRGIALTFDDGPHPQFTPQVLAQLRTYRVRAVFCVVGDQVRRHPQLVAQIVREGHTLCNHSWRHEIDLGTRPAAEIRANLERTNAAIRRAVPGARIPYFRQPGGRWTPAVVRIARQLDMVSLGWTVDPRDWEETSARSIRSHVLTHTRPGSVILLHDAGGERAATVSACRGIIPALKRRHEIVSEF